MLAHPKTPADRHRHLRRLVVIAVHFGRRAAHHEGAGRDEDHVRRRTCHRAVKAPSRGGHGGVSPQVVRGRELEKRQATPGVRLRQVGGVLNRPNTAHRTGDTQASIQLHGKSGSGLGIHPWGHTRDGQTKYGQASKGS